jgi:PPIC-type PPIASE domain/SurA N-terminal domain
MSSASSTVIALWLALTATSFDAVQAADASAPFATVGDTVISGAEYQRALAVYMRKKFYHAKPLAAEYIKFQREVGEEVVNRVLLLKEARRRGIEPDREKIAAIVADYDSQYKASPNWPANRSKMLAAVVPQLESDSQLERLGKIVKDVPEPDESVVRAYYEQHKALFIEPERVKLSIILLKVEPSSSQAVWNSAHEEGKQLHRRLRAGADFAELARLHSGDRSAANGGQMEYTHRGMLPEALHGAIDRLQARELSAPVQLLEGVAILRLDERRPSSQRTFESVKERAVDLWQREEADARWSRLIADLRGSVTIRINESQYGPLPTPTNSARGG